MEFIEFGQTTKSDHFFREHPRFLPTFEHLLRISNAIFGRSYTPMNRLEDIGFGLGHTCRDDFVDIVFLSLHGHNDAATKLLRGLYERALSLAYMILDPPKAERFVRFAAIQEHRMLAAALQVVPEAAFDEATAPNISAAQIRDFYQKIKPEFETTLCRKCGTKRTQVSWDIDVPAMAQKLGQPYVSLFLLAYTMPTAAIHATLASTFDGFPRRSAENPISLIVATELFLQVLRSQNKLFSLGQDAELDSCTEEFRAVFKIPSS
jgi:hypothetical protein